MSLPYVSDSSSILRCTRRKRELRTVAAMIGMYCRGHHGAQSATPCPPCTALYDYATRRLERCVFGDAKPTCAKCTVHCYSADKRERIRVVMKWAGPRMLLHHPALAVFHLLDGRRPAPTLPTREVLRRDPATSPEHPTER